MLFKKKQKDNGEKHGPRLRLPAVAKERLRRAGALVLALVLFMGAAFSDLPEGILSGLFSGLSAKASPTTKIDMELVYQSSGDDIVVGDFERSSDEDVWFLEAEATGQVVFCLNSGKSLHKSDTYTYSTVKASEYNSNSTAARAIKWYANHSGGYSMELVASGCYYGTWTLTADEVRALVQAYVWGGSTVADKVLKNYCKVYDGSTDQAQIIGMVRNKVVSEIDATSLTGYIYVYELYSCGKGSSATHQVLLGWDDEGDVPKYSYLEHTEPGVGIEGEEVELTIKKIDSTSKKTIDEAAFSLTMDGKTVTSDMVKAGTITVTQGSLSGSTFTTEDGCVKITYTGSSTTGSSEYFGKYWYVIDDGGVDIPSGYYKTKALAQAAMDADIKEWKASQNTSSNASHTWVATELTAPAGHKLSSDSVTVVTSGSQSKTMTFSDTRKYVADITVKKTYDDKYETQVKVAGLSLAGAAYTIYAGETVYNPSDNSSTLYSKDEAITTITTNSSGVAKLSASSTLLPAGYSYYIKETKAPDGWEIDDKVYYFDTSGTTITSEEEPIFGCVEIYKRYEVTVGNSSQEYPEVGAKFEIYYANEDGEATGNAITTFTSVSKIFC